MLSAGVFCLPKEKQRLFYNVLNTFFVYIFQGLQVEAFNISQPTKHCLQPLLLSDVASRAVDDSQTYYVGISFFFF